MTDEPKQTKPPAPSKPAAPVQEQAPKVEPMREEPQPVAEEKPSDVRPQPVERAPAPMEPMKVRLGRKYAEAHAREAKVARMRQLTVMGPITKDSSPQEVSRWAGDPVGRWDEAVAYAKAEGLPESEWPPRPREARPVPKREEYAQSMPIAELVRIQKEKRARQAEEYAAKMASDPEFAAKEARRKADEVLAQARGQARDMLRKAATQAQPKAN